MNHASSAVAALDPELIEVGDAIGQLCVPSIPSAALTSRVALPAVRSNRQDLWIKIF